MPTTTIHEPVFRVRVLLVGLGVRAYGRQMSRYSPA